MMESSYYMCVGETCVCVILCVFCAYDSSSASCISASGHPSVVREVSPSLWKISRVYLLPRPLIAFQGWFIFTFVLRKQTGFILSGCHWALTNLSASASQSNCPGKDVKAIEDRKYDLQHWTGLDLSSSAGCPASLFWWGPFSEVQRLTRQLGMGYSSTAEPEPGFTQFLPWILGYRYLGFSEPSFPPPPIC